MSISDRKPDDDVAGTSRLLRPPTKRQNLRFRPKKNQILLLVLSKLLKYWWIIIHLYIPLIVLLVFHSSIIIHNSLESASSGLESEVMVNMSCLQPTFQLVNGVITEESCAKLLPPEELQDPDIPLVGKHSFPVKSVAYISEIDRSYIGGKTTLPQQQTEVTGFNLFTGYQTLHEREQSFKVSENTVVHCGFYSKNGGFKVSDEDKNYMQTCEVVVSTDAFGGKDDFNQPIGMLEASLTEVCFVSFWDEITLTTQESNGLRIDEDHMIGRWRIVVVRGLPFVDKWLNSKIPKMLGHRLFPRARYSIWVDSKSRFWRDPLGFLEALLWRTNSVLAISEHGARSSIYDEGKAAVKKNKAIPEEVEVQLTQYHRDGFPYDKSFNGKKALAEASVIVREHTPLTNLFMCLWFNEVVRFTSCDQLSFPYVHWRLRVLKNINMIPVCTRKDLVNGRGHKCKVKF